ncbi:MAG: single-stranded DNA-binding protein [Candidatus Kapabacteria bacterium]|nr:single-stranded DNA-binding protein [Candidatus Kapabacteria bacterium]
MAGRSLNRATLIGNIGKDPELRTTPNGASVCTIRMATTEIVKEKGGGWKEVTDWHSVVFWDRLAEIAAQHLKKGDKIFVEGKLRTRMFERDGKTKFFTEIIANNMIILEKRNRQAGESTDNPELYVDFDSEKSEEDDNIFNDSYFTDEEKPSENL